MRKTGKHGICICTGLMMVLPIFQVIPFKPIIEDVTAGSTWLETTDTDFIDGTLENVVVDGSGASASVKLDHSGDNPPSNTPWYDTDWKFRRPITIDNTNNPYKLTDYQIYIEVAYDSDMRTDFSDLRFTEDDGVSEISHWEESIIQSTSLEVWVKVPTICGNESTIIFMYYGNPETISVSNYDTTFTKDFGEDGLVGLWHMDEGSGTTVSDYSGNGNHGTIYGASWEGEDGGEWGDRVDVGFSDGDCLSFNGLDDYLICGNDASLNITDEITIEAWIYAKTPLDGCIISKQDATGPTGPYSIVIADGMNRYDFRFNGVNYRSPFNRFNQWVYIISTYSRFEGKIKNYINGDIIDTWEETDSILTNDDSLQIGRRLPNDIFFNGLIDEVRIYDRALSVDEINCHYERRKHTWPEPEKVVGDEEGQYYPQGTFISSAFGSDDMEKNWNYLEWAIFETSGTDVEFQLRSADTEAELSGLEFVGTDGTSTALYTSSPFDIWSGHDDDAWIQYKANLKTTDVLKTPVLEDVTIRYNCIPDVPQLVSPQDDVWSTDNTPLFEWTFSDNDGSQQGFQVLIDDNSGFNNVDYDSDEQSSMVQSWQFPTDTSYNELEDGIWYWKVRTKDDDGDWSPYSSYWTLKVDSTAPEDFTPIVEPSGWTTTRQPKVTFSTVDLGCGLDHYEVSINMNEFSVETSPYVLPELSDGIPNVTIRAIDKVGNFRDRSVDVFIDTTPPDGFTPWTNWSSWRSDINPEISFETVDGGEGLSGMDRYEVKVMEGSYSVQTSPYTLPPQSDGQHHVFVRAFDVAGNYMDGKVDVYVDTTPPTITHTPLVNCTEGVAQFITAVVTDELSGVGDVTLYFKNRTAGAYTSLKMDIEDDGYSAMILESELTSDGLE